MPAGMLKVLKQNAKKFKQLAAYLKELGVTPVCFLKKLLK